MMHTCMYEESEIRQLTATRPISIQIKHFAFFQWTPTQQQQTASIVQTQYPAEINVT